MSVQTNQRTLRLGMSGDDVQLVQRILNSVISAGLALDGDFGSATEAAVMKYQEFRGLEVDGIIGPATWASLNSEGD